MTLRLLTIGLIPIALAACGSAPGDPSDTIQIVPATAARAAVKIASAGPAVAAVTPSHHVPTLTVEGSARINTSEMRSEPIAADAEETVIE